MRALSEFKTLNEINKSFGQQNKRDVKPPIEATRAIFERFFQIKQQIEQVYELPDGKEVHKSIDISVEKE